MKFWYRLFLKWNNSHWLWLFRICNNMWYNVNISSIEYMFVCIIKLLPVISVEIGAKCCRCSTSSIDIECHHFLSKWQLEITEAGSWHKWNTKDEKIKTKCVHADIQYLRVPFRFLYCNLKRQISYFAKKHTVGILLNCHLNVQKSGWMQYMELEYFIKVIMFPLYQFDYQWDVILSIVY